MGSKSIITSGHYSIAGQKPVNEDACGIRVPDTDLLETKGITAIIADGVSASDAGKEASEACVSGFLIDYYSTPESWTVKTSAYKVLTALNRWLHGQGHKHYGSHKGMVTTLSTMVIKSGSAHIFHVGDTRIYRVRDGSLECLTRDHCIQVGDNKTYLGRAIGVDVSVDIDYKTLSVNQGDLFLFTTDGVHDFVDEDFILQTVNNTDDNFDATCEVLVKQALANNSHDNLTCQLLRIEQFPADDQNAVFQRLTELPFPPPLDNGMRIDGYRITRQLHASKRTELYLAVDEDTDKQIVLKAPSINFVDDPTFIEQFQHEEWAGRRISNPHILKILEPVRPRKFLYCIAEYIEGQTLRQWIHDHPRPLLDEVRAIIEQIANGLRAMHKLEMIHQDLKPDNIMIDRHGTVKIIDLGSTKIAGIQEINSPVESATLLGTVNYTAPEYVRGLPVTNRSDIFSLGVITYEMLTGELPYGDKDTHKSLSHITALDYIPATKINPEIPAWVNGALKKATHPDPHQRYEILSGFLYDLSHPNTSLVIDDFKPLLEKNPLVFWKGLALLLAAGNIILVYLLIG